MSNYPAKRASRQEGGSVTVSLRFTKGEYDQVKATVERLNNRADLPGGITVTSVLRHCMMQWLDKWDKPEQETTNAASDVSDRR
jgi:hypothetical protein